MKNIESTNLQMANVANMKANNCIGFIEIKNNNGEQRILGFENVDCFRTAKSIFENLREKTNLVIFCSYISLN